MISIDESNSSITIGLLSIFILVFLIVALIALIKKCFSKKPNHIEQQSNLLEMNEPLLVNSLETPLDFTNFKKEKCIGKGSFGTVFLCSLPPDFKRKFALKHLNSIKNEVCFAFHIFPFT